MKCDLHVHTTASGMCHVGPMRRWCRESYTQPQELYETLKRRGMDLVTVTDHDSIDAAEELRSYPDFFLSEEVTSVTPSGTVLHVGVYDITEHQHTEIYARRNDLLSFLAFLREQGIFFSINHAFSRINGPRTAHDYELMRQFPAVETRNGQMGRGVNHAARAFAERCGKIMIAGSDAHTLLFAGRTFTDAAGANNKEDFLAALRAGKVQVRGQQGSALKLALDVAAVAGGMMREKPAFLALAPLTLLLPAITLLQFEREGAFAAYWDGQLQSEMMRAESSLAASEPVCQTQP